LPDDAEDEAEEAVWGDAAELCIRPNHARATNTTDSSTVTFTLEYTETNAGHEAAFGTERGDSSGPTSAAFLYVTGVLWDGVLVDSDPHRPLLLQGESRVVVREVTVAKDEDDDGSVAHVLELHLDSDHEVRVCV